MGKRNERRSRIERAFEHLRLSIATALGAAANQRAAIHAEQARQEFVLRIAQHSLADVVRDNSLIDGHEQPAFREALAEALHARDEAHVEWSQRGPAELTELVTEFAPGSAGTPWQDWLGEVGTAEPHEDGPRLWRIGAGTMPDSPHPVPFPVAVPLLDEAHLHIKHDLGRDGIEAAETLVQNLVMRVLSHHQPGQIRVHVWDIAQLAGTLPGLYPLTQAGLLTAYDPTRLEEMLEELSEHIRRIHTNALLGGHTSLRALAEEVGTRNEPWRIAVLFGNEESLADEQHQQIQRVARNGLACGIQLIMVNLPVSMNSTSESVRLRAPDLAITSMTGQCAAVRPDEAIPRDRVMQACTTIAESFIAKRSRVHTFADLLPAQLGEQSSRTGLQAPVGFHEGEPVQVTLGDASPHMLIGGPSGSGKTNFLYGMLGSFAARYSPDELELYLLDFKEGVSFAQFTPGRRDPSWLPHAQLVGVNVNADREFGVALLRFLADEMRRRADAAKAHEVTKLEELRAEDPEGRWPRIVAVIDEFQYLFAERDTVSAQATTLLEDVARRGRSQGIHLVLASQDVSGIEAFWGKSAVFEQFILRIALPKARRVLADMNFAAVELPRWHAVINHESGVKHGNEIARVPDATAKNTFDAMQLQLWEQCPADSVPPRLFDGSHLPDLHRLDEYRESRNAGGEPKALLGQVIDVAGTAAAMRLSRSPGRNIAILGSAVVDAVSALGAATMSLGRQYRRGEIEFTIAGLVGEVDADVDFLTRALRAEGHWPKVVGLDEIVSTVDKLESEVDNRYGSPAERNIVPHCFVLYAADAAHTRLEEKDPQTRVSGQDQLRKILKQGPESHIHTLGWWRSAQRLKNTIGMGPVDDIGAWVAFDVHGSELTTLAAGQTPSWSPRARRGLFFDRLTHSRPEVILPFDVSGVDTEAANLTTVEAHPTEEAS